MARSIFETARSWQYDVDDVFDDLLDTDPEETAMLNRQRELNEEANKKINNLLQALTQKINQFRQGEISGSFLSCEIFRLSYLINDEVVS